MISRAFIVCNTKPFPSIFRSIFAKSTGFAFSSLPHSSASDHDSAVLTRLNHKDWLTPKEVVNIIGSLKNPSSVVTVLDLYSKRKDYKPNEAFYTSAIQKLAQAKLFDDIEILMQKIKTRKDCHLSEDFFYGIIKVYGNMAGRINRAIESLYDMPNYDCWPSVKTFNFVLNLLVSAKLFDVVHEVYVSASQLGVEIDACSLNILIKGLCEFGKLEAAFDVLDEFPKLNCEPNVKTFSTIMRALCEKGQVEDAFGLLERMERDGVCPDTIVFNILIAGLRKQGRVEEGNELLEKMKLKGCEPNSGSYQEVLYGLLDERRFLEAKGLMERMISEDINPSFESYKLITNGFCQEKLLADVDWALKEMVRQGFVPKHGMWRHVIGSIFSQDENSCYQTLLKNSVDELICF